MHDSVGVAPVVEGHCPGGQVGAAYVRWPDGHRSVLTPGSPTGHGPSSLQGRSRWSRRCAGPAWAHMSLRMTDWAIRHFTPSAVEQWMDLAETRAI